MASASHAVGGDPLRAVPLDLGPSYWAIGANLAVLLTGGWLILAPYAVGGQSYTGEWLATTTNDTWCGLVVVVVAAMRLVLVTRDLATKVRAVSALVRRGDPRQPAQHIFRGLSVRMLAPEVLVLVGVWLIISPWVMQTQPAGMIWSPNTINNLVTGSLVMGLTLVSVGTIRWCRI